MIVDFHDEDVHGDWRVVLWGSNYRPGRWFVTVQPEPEVGLVEDGCVGFSDDEATGKAIFEAVSRTVALIGGENVGLPVWAGAPDGHPII